MISQLQYGKTGAPNELVRTIEPGNKQVNSTQDFSAFLEDRGISPFAYQSLNHDMQRYLVEAWQVECAIVHNQQRLPGQPYHYPPPSEPSYQPQVPATKKMTQREVFWLTISAAFVVFWFSVLLASGPKGHIGASDAKPISTSAVR